MLPESGQVTGGKEMFLESSLSRGPPSYCTCQISKVRKNWTAISLYDIQAKNNILASLRSVSSMCIVLWTPMT